MFSVQHHEPIRQVERITLTRIQAVYGAGIEEDPVRITTSWFDDDGNLIAYDDPCSPSEQNTGTEPK